MAIHILIVADEALGERLGTSLDAAGYRVSKTAGGTCASARAREADPDLILLDLGLRTIDGQALIRAIRRASDVPIIILTTRRQESVQTAAIDAGADDYITKPVERAELIARVRLSERRRLTKRRARFSAGGLVIDFPTRHVTVQGETIRLSPKEYRLLRALSDRPGEVVSHDRLLAAGWGDAASDTQYLRVYIGLLRQKIEEDPSDPRLILTEPGIGYRLAAAD